jgi:hypothetical protein
VGITPSTVEASFASVDLAAAFTLVLGEAPAVVLRFLTDLSARGGEDSPVSEKVGSVMCDGKGGKRIGSPLDSGLSRAPVLVTSGGGDSGLSDWCLRGQMPLF